MSITALTDLAVERDMAPPGASVAQFADALTKTIPTESLTAYTAFIAIIQSVAPEGSSYLPVRWWAFGGFMAITFTAVLLSYYRKVRVARISMGAHPKGRWTPLELVPALFAAAAWGLALPGGPLSALLQGAAETLTISAIIVGGGALVALTASPLPQPTSEQPAGTDPESSPGSPAAPDQQPDETEALGRNHQPVPSTAGSTEEQSPRDPR